MYGEANTENVVRAVEAVASRRGISMAQVALAWTFSKGVVSAPIVGTTSLDNLKDLLGLSNVSRYADISSLSNIQVRSMSV
jgi:aryl-alcohol dehydrogenase-like predicted oxidoreductase